jgi:hypothetical protein
LQLLKVGISSVVAATNRLHGHKFERELLDDVIVTLQQLLDKLGIDETEGLVNGAGSSMPSNDHEVNGSLDDMEDGEDERSSTIEEGGVAMDASADFLHDQLPAATASTRESDKVTSAKLKSKHGKRKKEYIGTRQQKSINDANPEIEDEGTAVQTEPKPEMEGKIKAKNTKKVSRDWMWNIDADLLVVNDIPVHFKRMGDLFAYHALTTVRSHLSPDATKGKIRKEIEQRISELSEEEYKIWRGSFEKLMNGDTRMLERATAGRTLNNNHPTPIPRPPLRTSEVKKRSREGRGGKSKRLHDNVEKRRDR